jgi:hypothetical protein
MLHDSMKLGVRFLNLETDIQLSKPALFVKEGGVMSLSGPELRDLLQAVLSKGFPFRFMVRGFSMLPFIRDGDVVTVSPFGCRKPGLGQVLGFVHPETGRLVIHRVIGRKDTAWQLRGDNASKSDGLVTTNNLIGRVTRVERKGQPVRLGLGSEKVFIALLNRHGLLPVFMSIGRMLRSILAPHDPTR